MFGHMRKSQLARCKITTLYNNTKDATQAEVENMALIGARSIESQMYNISEHQILRSFTRTHLF